jgi:hypothetical protein
VNRYRLHDIEGNDLGELEHPAPNPGGFHAVHAHGVELTMPAG